MTTLVFGLAYKLLDMDDDLEFFFLITALLDGICIYAIISEAMNLIFRG